MSLLLLIQKVKVISVDLSWLQKIDNFITFAIFFIASTQLGLHFWPTNSFIYGIKVDYLSPTIYFLDLLIFFSLSLKLLLYRSLKIPQIFYYFTPILLLNLIFSIDPIISINWILRFYLFGLFLINSFHNITKSSFKWVLLSSLFFQLFLGIVQILRQQSLQGLFYFLGERALSLSSPNVAKTNFLGKLTLRAYGTFNHPNILAGWFIIVFLILHHLYDCYQHRFWRKLLIIVTVIGLILAQSRSALLSFFVLILPLVLKLDFFYYYLSLALFSLYFYLHPLFSRSLTISLISRLELQKLSLKIISHFPFWGTGISASILSYPTLNPYFRLFQPDHNSLTLLLSWIGFFGLSSFFFVLFNKFNKFNFSQLLPLLPLFLLDHYLFTSTQGLFILMSYFFILSD